MASLAPTLVSPGHQVKTALPATPSPVTDITNTPSANCDSSSSDDPTATMPPRNPQRPGGRGAFRREIDLSGLLTPAQKTELVQLVNTLTDNMQQQITSIFELPLAPTFLGSAEAEEANVWGPPVGANNAKSIAVPTKTPPEPAEGFTTGRLPRDPHATGEVAAMIVNKRENEIAKKVQVELKKDVILAFKKWQTAVLKRVSDISAGREYPSQSRRPTPVAARAPPKPLPGKQTVKGPPTPPRFPSNTKAQKEGISPHRPHQSHQVQADDRHQS